jgi:hypothetical protein
MASAPHTTNANLAALVAAGTAPWLDQIRRGLIASGELARLRDECSLRGVTSNPAIFEQAILGSDDYDDALASWRTRVSTRSRSTSASRSPTCRTPPTCCAACTTSGATASSPSRSRRRSPTTPTARSRRRATTGRAWTARTC